MYSIFTPCRFKIIWALPLFLLSTLSLNAQVSSFNFDGLKRTYIVHLPTNYNASNKYSVVLSFHGYTDSALGQEKYTRLDRVADSAGFIAVYPNGINYQWNIGYNGFYYYKGVNDVGFINALIDTLAAKYNIDQRRVYACGWSDGGYFCYRLACDLSTRIAAIASVSGLMTDSMQKDCQKSCPVPIMHFHGTKDPEVYYDGYNHTGHLSVDSVLQFWIKRNHCTKPVSSTLIPNTDLSDSCTVIKFNYPSCADSSEIIFYKINNGGHTWPGGTFLVSYIGFTDEDINAGVEMWKFFSTHRLLCEVKQGINMPIDLWANIRFYPNPVGRELYIDLMDERSISSIALVDGLGRNLWSVNVGTRNNFSIPMATLPAGYYFLKISGKEEVLMKPIIKIAN